MNTPTYPKGFPRAQSTHSSQPTLAFRKVYCFAATFNSSYTWQIFEELEREEIKLPQTDSSTNSSHTAAWPWECSLFQGQDRKSSLGIT